MEIKKPLERLGRKVKERLDDYAEKTRAVKEAVTTGAMTTTQQGKIDLDHHDDPPVVARLIVEIRSDGTRTVAQGAMEDVHTGERVGVRAQGTTPTQLAASLAKSLFTAPLLARQAMRSMKQVPRQSQTQSQPQQSQPPRPQNVTPPATPRAKASSRPPHSDAGTDAAVVDVGEASTQDDEHAGR